jgi:serine/threonine-protein kinase ULK/ATG1
VSGGFDNYFLSVLPEKEALGFFKQLLTAFQSLQAENIIHRDLKPSNVMLHNGAIKLGDFGFCKALNHPDDLS